MLNFFELFLHVFSVEVGRYKAGDGRHSVLSHPCFRVRIQRLGSREGITSLTRRFDVAIVLEIFRALSMLVFPQSDGLKN